MLVRPQPTRTSPTTGERSTWRARPAGRLDWRRPRAARPRTRLNAAQGPELAGQHVALLAPRLLLLSLPRDDIGRRARDKVLVVESRRQVRNQFPQSFVFRRQPLALLLHVDGTRECHDA